MAQGETIVTITGNVTGDPELRFTASGAAVATFRVATNPRTWDRQTNEFKDGDPIFFRCSAWRQMAENVADSLQKGMRVVVTGRLKVSTYEGQDGTQRQSIEIDVEEVGPSLRFATAKVTRTQSQGGGGDFGGGGQRQDRRRDDGDGGDRRSSAPAVDPWSQAPDEEPPF